MVYILVLLEHIFVIFWMWPSVLEVPNLVCLILVNLQGREPRRLSLRSLPFVWPRWGGILPLIILVIIIILQCLLLPLLVLLVLDNSLDPWELVGIARWFVGIVQVWVSENVLYPDPVRRVQSKHLLQEVDGTHVGHPLLFQVRPQARYTTITVNVLKHLLKRLLILNTRPCIVVWYSEFVKNCG